MTIIFISGVKLHRRLVH